MYSILIVQLGGDIYFWALQRDGEWIATSKLIGIKKGVVEEAGRVGKELKIDNVFIDERS